MKAVDRQRGCPNCSGKIPADIGQCPHCFAQVPLEALAAKTPLLYRRVLILGTLLPINQKVV
ncbi:MAG: hypothetical protein LVR00_09380 [Rhabdochlamydiaceae bacterium]|jgi:hypothetical protein